MKTLFPILAALVVATSPAIAQTNNLSGSQSGPAGDEAIQKLEFDWAAAVKSRDVATLDRSQAAEFVFTDPGGTLWTKARELETIKAGDLEIDTFEFSDLKVRLYGDTAVVTFRIIWTGRFRGADRSGPQRMTDVWVKRDGRWQCVASQATRIAGQ